jgi:flagellar biosynthesis/type III secretory pathway protein FliH
VSEFKPLFKKRPDTGFSPNHLTPQYALEQEAAAKAGHNSSFQACLPNDSAGPAPGLSPADPGSPAPNEGLEATESPVNQEPPVDLEDLIAQARAEGIEEGRQQAAAEFEQLNQQVDSLNSGLDQLHVLHRESLQAAANDIATMISALTKRLFYDNLVLHPKALSTLLEEALNAMPEDHKVWVTAHPDHVERLGNLLTTGREIEIIEDETVQAGFRIHNKFASIDSTLTKLLEGIDAAVQQWQQNQ